MKLQEKRMACNMGQQELAKVVGTSVPMISNFEHYKCLPIPKMLNEICKALNCTLSDLYESGEIYVNAKTGDKVIKVNGKLLVYKLTVSLPNEMRKLFTQKNLELCGYHSLKDFIWHCCKRFEKQLAIIKKRKSVSTKNHLTDCENDNIQST